MLTSCQNPKGSYIIAFIEYYSVLFSIWLTWEFEPVRYVSHMAHLGHKGLKLRWLYEDVLLKKKYTYEQQLAYSTWTL
jgi:hypothetical protein